MIKNNMYSSFIVGTKELPPEDPYEDISINDVMCRVKTLRIGLIQRVIFAVTLTCLKSCSLNF